MAMTLRCDDALRQFVSEPSESSGNPKPRGLLVAAERVLKLVVILLIGGCGGGMPEGTGAPLMRLSPESEVNLGTLTQGTTAHGSFEVCAGPVPLGKIRVETGCGCTRAQVSASELKPGGTARVDFWVQTENRPNQRLNISIRVLAEASGREINASTRCRASVVSIAGLAIVPPEIHSDAQSGETLHRTVAVTIAEADQSVSVHEVRAPKWIHVDVVKESQAALRLELDGIVPQIGGLVSDHVELDLKIGENVVRRRIPMVIQVKSMLAFDRTAIVAQIPAGDSFKTQVPLRFEKDVDAEIESIVIANLVCDPPGAVESKINTHAEPGLKPSYSIEISGQFGVNTVDDDVPGVCRGSVDVEIRLSRPSSIEVLRLPFLFVKS